MSRSSLVRSVQRWLSIGGSVLGVIRALGGGHTTNGLDEMKSAVRSRFPQVPQLQTAELADWLANPHREPPLLLDVRTEPEFKVSHLPGAVRVDPSAKGTQLRPLLELHRPIVVYCSVGYRSSDLATRLRSAGQTNVSNLEGSIFAWANEDRPLVTGSNQPVRVVHPYNQTFGKLLRRDHWPEKWEPPR
jgi:rhodanese-related sulfurtransferase